MEYRYGSTKVDNNNKMLMYSTVKMFLKTHFFLSTFLKHVLLVKIRTKKRTFMNLNFKFLLNKKKIIFFFVVTLATVQYYA
jgi:hypothetical protein